ncbi:MAG: helix-turn-helix domain-containing protein [Steroidobacteraceae bacterium]|nr:helix-turn-helix domain-containing protein [Steroidobacteraceae bacterium]
MKDEKLGFIRGSGNVYRDFGYPDADLLLLKANVAGSVIRMLDQLGLTVRKAQELTGIAAADFSRIRQADLDRFTLDRLIIIASRLGAKFRLTVRHPRASKRRREGSPELDAVLKGQKQVRVARGKLKWTGNLEEMRRD